MTDNNDEYDEFYDDVVGGEPPQSSPPTGYGKPPVANQFRKGTSGNRYGRPRKRRQPQPSGGLMDALAVELVARQLVKRKGKPVKMSMQKIIATTLVQDTLNADPKVRHDAIKMLMKMGAFQSAEAYEEFLRKRAEIESSSSGWTADMEERFQIIEAEFFENPVPRPKGNDKASSIITRSADRDKEES